MTQFTPEADADDRTGGARLRKDKAPVTTEAARPLERLSFRREKLPTTRSGQWSKSSDYFLLNLANEGLWVLRLMSPAAWIMACCQRQSNGTYYTHPTATEVYQLVVTALACALALLPVITLQSQPWIAWLCVVFALEAVQYQFRSVVMRPTFQKEYKLYSAARTLLILLLQYVQMVFLYAAIYLSLRPNQFSTSPLTKAAALEYSVMIMTTVGSSNTSVTAGSLAGFVTATQGLFGVFLFGLMVGTTMSRIRAVAEVTSAADGDAPE